MPTSPTAHSLNESLGTQVPRVDASADLYVNVIEDDVRCATPRDHCNCAVAQAVKRAVGHDGAEAVIFPSIAYVMMPVDRKTKTANKNVAHVKVGQMAWHRFRIMHGLHEQILLFDETGQTATGGYRFTAPSPSQRLGYRRLQNDKPIARPGSRPGIAKPAPWRRARAVRFPK